MLLEHNKEFYEHVKDMLLKYRECCFISAPGTGKSNIATEFIKEMGNLNALVISPKVSISDNWSNMPTEYGFAPTISTVTYQYFCKYYKELYGFDIYIFDEAHHCGAQKWFSCIKEFRDNLTNEFVLGLTATPRRYSDNFKDVSDFVFHGHTVYGLDQKTAIQLGIIQNAIYVKSLYDTKPLFDLYRKKNITEALRIKLDLCEKNCMSIVDILKEHTQNGSNIKGVLFVDTIARTEEGLSIINEAFPELQTYCIHSGLSQKSNKTILNAFKCASSGFMVSVGMLNEGIHVQGVNMVILLRKTWSPTIFIQQIGRCLSVNGEMSTIFDFVNNWKSIQAVMNMETAINNGYIYSDDICDNDIYSEDEEYISRQYNMGTHNDTFSDLFIVDDKTSDILSVFNEIDEYCRPSKPWTKDEIAILEEYYPTMGLKVAELLPNRTVSAISSKVYKCNILRTKRWTPEEDQILISNYEELGPVDILDLLPGKTRRTCALRAMKYGIKFKHSKNKYGWTPEEDQILRDNYPTIGPEVYTLLQNRNKYLCKKRADMLGLRMIKSRKIWTPEEDKILIENYPTMGTDVYMMFNGNRDKKSCKARAYALKLIYTSTISKWTPEEDQILRDNYPTMGADVQKLLPNRAASACKRRANKLGLVVDTKMNAWTSEEDQILKDNYPTMGRDAFKLLPGRTAAACDKRINNLGISIYNKWTPEEDQILKDNYPTMGRDVFKLLPGRTSSACKTRASYLGLYTGVKKWTPEEDKILRDNYPTMGPNVCMLLPDRSRESCKSRASKLKISNNDKSKSNMM